jgi:hypothetical protein
MLKFATTMLKDFLKDEAGQDLVEYALARFLSFGCHCRPACTW